MPIYSIKLPPSVFIVLMAQDGSINISEHKLLRKLSAVSFLIILEFSEEEEQKYESLTVPSAQTQISMGKVESLHYAATPPATLTLPLTSSCFSSYSLCLLLFLSSHYSAPPHSPSSPSLYFYLRVDVPCPESQVPHFSWSISASHRRRRCTAAFWAIKQQPAAIMFTIKALINV